MNAPRGRMSKARRAYRREQRAERRYGVFSGFAISLLRGPITIFPPRFVTTGDAPQFGGAHWQCYQGSDGYYAETPAGDGARLGPSNDFGALFNAIMAVEQKGRER